MIVGGERVVAEAHLPDVVAIRQPPAAETVNLEHGARAAGHRLELRGELLGVVGQPFELLFFEHGAHGVAATIVGGRGVGDDHLLLEARKIQRHRLTVVTAAKGDGAVMRHETGNLDVELHRAGGQSGNRDDAARIRADVHGRAVGARDPHGRLRHAAARLVHHGDAQRRVAGGIFL